ncbi:hypothetical protein VNO78_15402 [Psophocarpus tetragonolobus]|uniref:Uncharacterized protein n=1 Tax=Psophocarpus tetragonolobus TaxID=3891 RepID=A0AAN9SEJ2_PSOTE
MVETIICRRRRNFMAGVARVGAGAGEGGIVHEIVCLKVVCEGVLRRWKVIRGLHEWQWQVASWAEIPDCHVVDWIDIKDIVIIVCCWLDG